MCGRTHTVTAVAQHGTTSALHDPLEVEFAHAGGWHPGVLLGWSHDDAGTCWMRVQCLVGGLRRTTWMPLTELRLPEPAPAGSAGAGTAEHHRTAAAPRPRTGLAVAAERALTPA